MSEVLQADSPTETRQVVQVSQNSRRFAKLIRWLHIYLSMLSFSLVLFFSVTGITLNHPGWLGGQQKCVRESQGELNPQWISPRSSDISRLDIVEFLRSQERLRGVVDEFTIDEYQILITFRAPAYSADVFVDRETCQYDLVEMSLGMVALLNDLHKGRDSGMGWSVMIDVSAILLIFVSLTGFTLIFYLKRHRTTGLIACLVGLFVTVVLYLVLVPR